ncbi:hypothetical protein ACE1OG_07615 [Aeromonas hydrophila]|jgi:hypothetical protein
MSRNNDGSDVLVISGGILALFTWGIVSVFGVPWKVAIDTVPGMLMWIVLFGVTVFLQKEDILGKFTDTWPLLLGGMILVLSPILNHWAGGRYGEPLFIEPAWYGKSSWQWLMSISIAAAGFGFKWWRRDRYY